jgi:hypothetical protein
MLSCYADRITPNASVTGKKLFSKLPNVVDKQGNVIEDYLEDAKEIIEAQGSPASLNEIFCDVSSKGMFDDEDGILRTDIREPQATFAVSETAPNGALVNVDKVIYRYVGLNGQFLNGRLINPPPGYGSR